MRVIARGSGRSVRGYRGASMGWGPVDPRIEKLRSGLADDPAAVRREVANLLAEARARDRRLRPADRLRLLGLVVAAGRKLGDLDSAEAAAIEGSMIATRSRVANADFLNHLAALRIVQERPADALWAVDQAAELLAEELKKPQPSSKESLRRRRWIQSSIVDPPFFKGGKWDRRPRRGRGLLLSPFRKGGVGGADTGSPGSAATGGGSADGRYRAIDCPRLERRCQAGS
jgi:hypothetical protein